MKNTIFLFLALFCSTWMYGQEYSIIKDIPQLGTADSPVSVTPLSDKEYLIHAFGINYQLDSTAREQYQYLFKYNSKNGFTDSVRIDPPHIGFRSVRAYASTSIAEISGQEFIHLIVRSKKQQPSDIWIYRFTTDLEQVFMKKIYTGMYSQETTSLFVNGHFFLGVEEDLDYYNIIKFDENLEEIARWRTEINRHPEPRGSNVFNFMTLLADGRILITIHEEYGINLGTRSFRYSYFLDQDLNCLKGCDDHLIEYVGAYDDRKWNFVGTPDGGIICNTVMDYSTYTHPIGFYRHDKDFRVLTKDSIWNEIVEESDFVWNLVPISNNRYLGMGTSTIFYRNDIFTQYPDSFLYYQVKNNALAFVIDEYGKVEWFKYIHNYDTDFGSWLVDGLEMDNGQFLFVGTASKIPEDVDTNPKPSNRDTWIMTLDENGCYNGDCSNYMWIKGDSTGNFYPEIDFTSNIRDWPQLEAEVFPNPADHELSINIKAFGTRAKVTLMHVSGAHQMEYIITQSEQKIDISDLPAGAYLLMIQENEKVYVDKIVVR